MILLIIFLFLSACSNIQNDNIVAKYPEDQKHTRVSKNGFIFNEKNISFKMNKKENNNQFQKIVSIISKYLPILIIDEKNNFISSDWGTIEELSENKNLYKINVYIKNNNPEITVFEKNSKNLTSKNENVKNKIINIINDNNE